MARLKKYLMAILVVLMIFAVTACSSGDSDSGDQTDDGDTQDVEAVEEEEPTEEEPAAEEDSSAGGGKTLIIYYDYSENMGSTDGMSADVVTSASLNGDHPDGVDKNDLLVIVDEIQKQTGADVFSLRVNEPYDPDYSTMVYVAQDDQNQNKHFTFVEDIDNLRDYDTIYIGMPVWWSKLPQPMRVFVEEHDFGGKTIIPFGIHRGSGFGQMIDQLEGLAEMAEVSHNGYTVNATTANDTVRKEVDDWLKTL